MPKYAIRLIKKEVVAENTMAFHFEKPKDFTYIAGQYGDFTLINPPETDDEGDKRTFSLASTPFQIDLVIATRIRDTAFKRTLKNLSIGSEVQFEGPFGSLALPKTTSKPAVFLTGGIGATLVRSMITQVTHDQSPHKMIFFYSNDTPKSAVFLDEFNDLAGRNQNFTFIPTMTSAQEESWMGEKRQITLKMIREHVPDVTNAIYYLSGPGIMVGAMRKLLIDAGVERSMIRSDLFVGYEKEG